MNYAEAGLQAAANVLGGGAYAAGLAQANKLKAAPPVTIQSAIGKYGEINSRLAKIVDELGRISSQVGVPYGLQGPSKGDNATVAAGLVHQLNDGANHATELLAQIESHLAGISRTLG